MIKDWMAAYKPTNDDETLSALREIMQEIALAGLSRTDFFENAAFYGGTALRIFYGLDRFSDDLDFSLLEKNPDFSLETYFAAIVTEFEAIGMKVNIKEKDKRIKTSIESAFLKSNTIWKELVLEDIVQQAGIQSNKSIKVKIEVDCEPPLGYKTEEKLLLRPFSFYVKCFTRSNLFAGKMHALLFRKWKNRIKGRDWYDLEWYIKNGIPLDMKHFLQRAINTGDWNKKTISEKQITALLQEKIKSVSFDKVKEDVVRFIKDEKLLEIWNLQYFNDLIGKIKFE
ncbi:MAG: nucleotidyl transferase AbiEii/AbiGii toxin family protein [Chitinophagales bacterium]|jgi:predicted nucleotidyltransferase component of viral defense system|nr:nucleotidyl transferase AbiEii/AbiGii toxin family protein [Chitinophagales bacterium]MBP6153809.1 nucleotidyl transferase AbiEii/AbiGii toxin family protein [Chitinophagales bacterium]HQV77708.1 nucleotidyl transferase AbiEii/AbiGii toxin family protein [Chitinophagales bacterium]HRB66568.1 nucleotidyl transferase AbiEii/AbiGii toxin family protein [Chitinophagales bacterium]HRB68704.1 nucleotidyl transferase AbiEii/AbiGii toxin family protein [Chitinophagales bacterium]